MLLAVSSRRRRVGTTGERAALARYRALGYRVVARNWRSRLGELDLVLERRGTLVFCEVKTRSSAVMGGGYEGVTTAKRRKVRALADAFLLVSGVAYERLRFDVASVALGPGGRPSVHLYEDAF